MLYVRRESDGCPDASTALLLGKIDSIVASAWRPTKWILLLVRKATVADLLLHAVFCP
jgi:hypothetical protein